MTTLPDDTPPTPHELAELRMSAREMLAVTVLAAFSLGVVLGAIGISVLIGIWETDAATVDPSPLQSDPDRPPQVETPPPVDHGPHPDLSRGRAACEYWLARGAARDASRETCEILVEEAARAGVDQVLAVAMAYHESRLSPSARNSSGCCGIMQVKTGPRYSDRPTCDELTADVRLAARTGLEIYVEYDRSLAAYNAGRAGARAGGGRGYEAVVRRYAAEVE